MSTKTRRILSTVLMALPPIMLVIGGIMKIAGAEPAPVVEFLTKSGFGKYITLLGISQIIIAALILYPKTIKIGFLLGSCYFAAALCLEISGGQPVVSAVFLVILWVGMFLKHEEMFVSAKVGS